MLHFKVIKIRTVFALFIYFYHLLNPQKVFTHFSFQLYLHKVIRFCILKGRNAYRNVHHIYNLCMNPVKNGKDHTK